MMVSYPPKAIFITLKFRAPYAQFKLYLSVDYNLIILNNILCL